MENDVRFTIIEPAVVQRVGKMQQAFDLAVRLEEGVRFNDGSHLVMSARADFDSSYVRLNNFWFPIYVQIQVMNGKKLQSLARVSFWKREEDSQCLVMIDTNSPEDNFEGSYEEALNWTVHRVCEKTAAINSR